MAKSITLPAAVDAFRAGDLSGVSDSDLEAAILSLQAAREAVLRPYKALVEERERRVQDAAAKRAVADMPPQRRAAMIQALGIPSSGGVGTPGAK